MCRLWKIQIQFWGYKLSNATWRVLNDFTLSEPYWYKAWVRLRMGNLYIMNAKHKGCKNVSSLLPFTHNHPHFTKHKITNTSQNTKSPTLHKTQNHPPFTKHKIIHPSKFLWTYWLYFGNFWHNIQLQYKCNMFKLCEVNLIITTLIDYA